MAPEKDPVDWVYADTIKVYASRPSDQCNLTSEVKITFQKNTLSFWRTA